MNGQVAGVIRVSVPFRPARASPPVGPLASDELAVPPQQRLGRDHERAPPIPREGSARRGEEQPAAVPQLRA
jgi:hypothetical protein